MPWQSLEARETCDEGIPGADVRPLARPTWIFTTAQAALADGNAGNRWAQLRWRDQTGLEGLCLYQEHGAELRLSFCTTRAAYDSHACEANPHRCTKAPEVLRATEIPRGGLIEAAVEISFHLDDRGTCKPASATIALTTPPDADGDGIPECVANPPDVAAPTWPAGSSLTAAQRGADAALLSWSEAIDNTAVAGYRIFRDGAVVATVDGLSLEATVTGLAPDLTYAFRVEAFDLAGNVSSGGPVATLRLDDAAPAWPAGSTLTVSASTVDGAHLVWSAATDNIAVTGYRILQDGVVVRELAGDTLTAEASGLVLDVTYTFQVQAFDAVGNVSQDGPSATLTLDGEAPSWPAGSTLAATATSRSSATLVWTPATDNVGVHGYRVLQDGVTVRELGSQTLALEISDLLPEVTYTFQVEAVDVATGAVAQRLEHDPFGRLLRDSNPGFQPFGYAGGLPDPATGLVHFGVREYDPETGRWLSKEPLGFGGGDTNLFVYAGNDPVNFIDPEGTFIWFIAAGWALVEIGLSAWDIYDTAKTLLDPCASGWEKFTSGGMMLAGLILPGGGYSAGSKKVAKELAKGVVDDAAESGIVYLRRNVATAREYVGQAKPGRFRARQAEHAANHPGQQFEFHILEEVHPGSGRSLDVAEEDWIRAGGGPSRFGGPLENDRYQMSEKAYKAAGGTIPKPTY